MSEYKNYPAIDDDHNFPPAIRRAIAESNEVGARVEAMAEPLVVAAIGSDTVVVEAASVAASAAVEQRVAGLDLAKRSDPGMLNPTADDSNLMMVVTDENEKRVDGVMELGSDGRVSERVLSGWRDRIVGSFKSETISGDDILRLVDAEGRQVEALQADSEGNVPEWVLTRWAERMGWGETETTSKSNVAYPIPKIPEGLVIGDAIHEWWCKPMHIWDGHRLLASGITSNRGDGRSDIIVSEWIPGEDDWRTVILGDTFADDHNTPTIILTGSRLLAMWTEHNVDNVIKIAVSDPGGSLESLVRKPVISINIGGASSYTQPIVIDHLRTETTETVWIFTRRGTTAWGWVPVTVDLNAIDDPLSAGSYRSLVTAPGRQCYISVSEAHDPNEQVLRVAWGYNPAQPVHAIRAIEIRPKSGVISSPFDSNLKATTTGTGLPIVDNTVSALIAESESGFSRRLYYTRPGPMPWAVSYSDWPVSNPDAAMQKVISWNGTSWVTNELVIAGPRVGYTAEANYTGTVAFPDPCYDDTVAVCYRDSSGTDHIEIRRTVKGVAKVYTLATSKTHRLVRPFFPAGAGSSVLIYSEVSSYGANNFTAYKSNLVLVQLKEEYRA